MLTCTVSLLTLIHTMNSRKTNEVRASGEKAEAADL